MIFSTIRKFTIILVYCSHLAHINQIQAIELFELVIADNILNDGPLRNCMIGNYLSILMVMMILCNYLGFYSSTLKYGYFGISEEFWNIYIYIYLNICYH